ncbi:hypothetical protein ABZ027_42585 [Streptomyces sp. NPDC006332]|uniref:hypothetical protein n=1 Tax=Streptomyces sp. NPDC006332 TaxID=3155456 RepID=UPI0033A14AC9
MTDRPVPPPFMWACRRCADLLIDIATATALSTEHDLYDGTVRCQLMLAGHLAAHHLDAIPEPHTDCPRCDFYAKQPDRQHFESLWAEHRARDLFLPAEVARLM